jgi:hypothetical protein
MLQHQWCMIHKTMCECVMPLTYLTYLHIYNYLFYLENQSIWCHSYLFDQWKEETRLVCAWNKDVIALSFKIMLFDFCTQIMHHTYVSYYYMYYPLFLNMGLSYPFLAKLHHIAMTFLLNSLSSAVQWLSVSHGWPNT